MHRKRLNNKMIFKQDEALPHFSKVRTWLNEKFNGRWIGRSGLISWAPRSPDSTPLDFFFLWRYIKTKVYKTMVNDTADLKETIEQGIKTIKMRHWKMFFMVSDKDSKFVLIVNGDTFEQKLLVSNETLKISLSFKNKLFDLVTK